MARDAIAKMQDSRAKARAESEIGDITSRLAAARAFLEGGHPVTPEILDALRAVEAFMEGFAPKFSQAGVGVDGTITFSGAGFITTMAGQIAAMMEDRDADNYLFVPFTIGPKDGGPAYEFTINRLAPGKVDMAKRNGELVEALTNVLRTAQDLAKTKAAERDPIVGAAAGALIRACATGRVHPK